MHDHPTEKRAIGRVLGAPVDRISCDSAVELIGEWAACRSSRVVLAANVHMTMEALDDAALMKVMEEADLVVADGQPISVVLRALGYRDACHVRGQDLVLAVCAMAARCGCKVGIYGTTSAALEEAERYLCTLYPSLEVAYSHAPPFFACPDQDEFGVADLVNDLGVQILFVSLGCPKQEKWMAANAGRIAAVMIGAGAAIDMIGGRQPVAPAWMRASSLEWAFRLASDPGRLWRRYAKYNLRFMLLAGIQVAGCLGHRRSGAAARRRG